MSDLKDKTVKGVMWSSIDRFSTQGIQFVFSILIARLLMPEDYGVVAMLNIFLSVSQKFIDSGFGTALIRKPDRTEIDFSTVFYFNIVVSIFSMSCYGLLHLPLPHFMTYLYWRTLPRLWHSIWLSIPFPAYRVQNSLFPSTSRRVPKYHWQ